MHQSKNKYGWESCQGILKLCEQITMFRINIIPNCLDIFTYRHVHVFILFPGFSVSKGDYK